MKRILSAVLVTALILLPIPCGANHRIVDDVGIDRVTHAGISYLICDQLRRNAGMNNFWAGATTIAIGALKEWSDGHFDSGDFAADCAGVLMYQVRF